MEAELAETAPQRPLALTIGAAVVTLLVILGVFTGPAVIDCLSTGNIGLCLRDKIAGTEQPAVAQVPTVVPAEAAAPAAAVSAVPAPAVDMPQVAATPEAPPATIADGLVAATFGLLRAQPDGSMVIAGSGQPGTQVQVYANGDLLGQADVERSGDWVLVPEKPLASGGAELTLGQGGTEARSAQSYVVVIDPDRTTQPLVVATAPGAASEILQGLDRPLSGTNRAVASAPASAPLTADAAAVAPSASAAVAAPVESPPQQVASTSAAGSATNAGAATTTTAGAAVATNNATTAVAPTTDAGATVAPNALNAPVDVAASGTGAPSAVPGSAPTPVSPDIAVAAASPAAPVTAPLSPAGVTATAAPTIDAIEIDGNRNFFAGSGPEGATVRLYVNDKFIADGLVTAGRWLVETANVLVSASQRIRVDLLKDGGADVASRAEVDFVVDVPQPADATASPTAVAARPASPGVNGSAPATLAQGAPAEVPSASGQSSVAQQAQAPAGQSAQVPAAHTVQAPAGQTAVGATRQTTGATADVPTMVATQVGDPAAQRLASGKAIIRRGDNLWTIARRVYGQGMRYTTIYNANTAQIRNPDRIYPGQVFDLPDD